LNGDDTWPSCFVTRDFARQLETEVHILEAVLKDTLIYLDAWSADWSKCRNQHISIDRIKEALREVERLRNL